MNIQKNCAENNFNCEGLFKIKNFCMLPRDHSCGILVENVATFCPCPKSLSDANVKKFGLILLAEEISKQSSIDSHVVTSVHAYNDL